jgi:hypothetical protein
MVLTDLTVKALATATDALHGVLDKAGKPMVSHAIAVAETMPDEISTVVALLHDVIEDSPLTRHSLVFRGFPDEVVEAVEALTRQPEEDYFVYLGRIKLNGLALRVKLADLEHNCDLTRLPSVCSVDRVRLEKYRRARDFLLDQHPPGTKSI